MPANSPLSAPSPQTDPTQFPITPVAEHVLGEFTDSRGFRRLYLLVSPELSDAQIVDLARRVHAREDGAWLWFLNSDEKIAQVLATLPATEKGDTSQYPGQWVEAHTVAHSAMEVVLGEKRSRWRLFKGPYSAAVLAELPCPPSDQHCR